MKRIVVFAAAMAAVGALAAGGALARGIGGAPRGGSAARAGGGFSAAARPSLAAGHTPTMTRSVPPARPPVATPGPARGAGAVRAGRMSGVDAGRSLGFGGGADTAVALGGGMVRPGRGGTARSPRPARAAVKSPTTLQKPTSQQVGNFLNLPLEKPAGPSARASSPPTGVEQKTFETKRGGEITVTKGAGSKTTPGGATIGGAGVAVQVETAGGASATKVTGVAGATKGGKTAAVGGTAAGVKGPGGRTAAAARGTAIKTDGTRTVVKQGAAVRGPGGNVVTAGRGAAFVNGQFVGGATWSKLNGTYRHWNAFGPGWHIRYPAAWWPGKWAIPATAWAAATWALAGAYCGCTGDGAYYDYGGNVYYEDGNVYYGDQVVGTEEEYYSQAQELAAAGQNTQNEDWLPLGVFAIVAEGQTQSDTVIQFAVNKQGVIRGNYQDFLTDQVTPVYGSVDKQTQRVAVKLQGNDKVVIETGLYDLTNDEAPALIHIGKDRQEKRLLVRLKQPEEAAAEKQP